jgi:hypothetical protein
MRKYLYPNLSNAELLSVLKFAVIGAMVAGFYGVVHDQITYSISHEYFTKLKFNQFAYANFGLGDRVFVGTIGFLATWWVGLFAGWFLARWFTPRVPSVDLNRTVFKGFAIILFFGFSFALFAALYGMMIAPSRELEGWSSTLKFYGIVEKWPFVRVAYIHNGSYLGGLVGLIVSFFVLGRSAEPVATDTNVNLD